MAIATSFGLLWRRFGQEKAGLVLATFPVCACVLFLILYHPYDLYPPPFAAMDMSRLIAEILLAILIPASIWWWFLLTRQYKLLFFGKTDRGDQTVVNRAEIAREFASVVGVDLCVILSTQRENRRMGQTDV